VAATIIAKNQTAGDLALTQLIAPDRKIPASGQVQLTDWNTVSEIQSDKQLKAYITSDDVLLNINGTDQNKAQSLAEGIASVAPVADGVPRADDGAELAAAWLKNFVGDSGSGGTKGAAPAPAAGDAAAGKFLKADGTWSTAPSGGSPTSQLVAATAGATTTSTDPVLVPGATITPAAGTYLVWFTGSAAQSNKNNSAWTSVHSGGVIEQASERLLDFAGALQYVPFSCVARVTVDGAQAIEGRWRVDGVQATLAEATLAILRT